MIVPLEGCPTRPQPSDGPRGCWDILLGNHLTGSAGYRSSEQLTFWSVIVQSEPGTSPQAGVRQPPRGVPAALPEPTAAPRPYLLLGSWAEAVSRRVHGSGCRRLSRRGPPGRARHSPGAERGAGGEQELRSGQHGGSAR